MIRAEGGEGIQQRGQPVFARAYEAESELPRREHLAIPVQIGQSSGSSLLRVRQGKADPAVGLCGIHSAPQADIRVQLLTAPEFLSSRSGLRKHLTFLTPS